MTGKLYSPKFESGAQRRRVRKYERSRLDQVLDDDTLGGRLEGQVLTKESLESNFSLDEQFRVLQMNRIHVRKEQWDHVRSYFEKIDRKIDASFEQIDEPIAVFGSYALYSRDPKATNIPADVDIATTPLGAEKLYDLYKDDDEVVIIEDLLLVNEGTNLSALRFAGYFIIDGDTQSFEVLVKEESMKERKLVGSFV